MTRKLNSERNIVSDNSRNKKPILERLGLIEAVIQDHKEDELDITDESTSTASEIISASDSTDSGDSQERIEKNSIEKLEIQEIFDKFGLETKETNTIYLIENFIKALPANLPTDIKRQSIINLISVSQLDIILLLKDGNKRLDILNNYYNDFSNNVDDVISSNEKQIRKLNDRIAYHNRIIEEKQKLREVQRSEIEFEMQKLTNIIEFVENKARQ